MNVMKEPFLDLTPLIENPLGGEISLAVLVFISIFLVLWLLSKLFNFKKQKYNSALLIAIIVSTSSFIIRSISLIFSLTDIQKPVVNNISMIIEFLLLLFLVKKTYNLKWFKSIFITIITHFGKFVIMGILMLIIVFSFTTIPKDIYEESINFGTFEEIQEKTKFGIIEPSYLPKDYNLLNVKSLNDNSIILHYQYKTKNKNYGISLKETFLDVKPKLIDYSPSGEEITINGEKAILSKDNYNSLILTWYSSKLRLLFILSTGVNGGLEKEELIEIAKSIST